MRRVLFLLAAVLVLGACAGTAPLATSDVAIEPALSPPEGDAAFAAWLETERADIERGRMQAHQRYEELELECWRRFAVNDCLRRARRQRRARLDALQSRALALNAQERARRTAHRLQRIQDKSGDASPGG